MGAEYRGVYRRSGATGATGAVDHLRLLPDDELADLVERLEHQVRELAAAEGEIGQRIRDDYAAALDRARLEIDRRRA